MIDLETLGTKPDSVVLSIGACFFDPHSNDMGEQFYAEYRGGLQWQLDNGRKISASTLRWWMDQGAAALRVFTGGTPVIKVGCDVQTPPFNRPLDVPFGQIVGEEFVKYIGYHNKNNVLPWSHGASFDIPMVEDLLGHEPWDFWNIRDTRTLFDITGVKPDRSEGTHHNALDDAIQQAKAVQKAYAVLKGWKTPVIKTETTHDAMMFAQGNNNG